MGTFTAGVGVVKALKNKGVDTVFGIPGVHNLELYRGLEGAGVRHILARNEQGAGFMADGYARATGKPGVAFVISGPGLTNIITPMGQAYSDSVPMLVISSCLPETAIVPGQLHEMRDQIGAAETVCDWSELAQSPDAVRQLLNRAFSEFSHLRTRPKHIGIPIDVLSSPGSEAPAPDVKEMSDTVAQSALENAADRIRTAKKPLFVFGGGAKGAAKEANELVAKLGAAVFTTYAGRGVIKPDYPLLFGATLARQNSQTVLADADLIVVVGSELAQVDLWRDRLGHQCDMVRIDRDPVVLADQHSAEVVVCGDAKTVLGGLIQLSESSKSRWSHAEVSRFKTQARAQSEAMRPGILTYVDAMGQTLSDDALIYSDMTQFAYVAKENYALSVPGCWHHPSGFGSLGYALPAAIGGKIGRPDRQVVAIAGDSGFQYTMSELGVAAELSLCLPIVLWDNGKLKEIQDAMESAQIAPNAVFAKNPDFKCLAKAYAINYERPENPEAFRAVLSDALSHTGPTLIHLSPNGAP